MTEWSAATAHAIDGLVEYLNEVNILDVGQASGSWVSEELVVGFCEPAGVPRESVAGQVMPVLWAIENSVLRPWADEPWRDFGENVLEFAPMLRTALDHCIPEDAGDRDVEAVLDAFAQLVARLADYLSTYAAARSGGADPWAYADDPALDVASDATTVVEEPSDATTVGDDLSDVDAAAEVTGVPIDATRTDIEAADEAYYGDGTADEVPAGWKPFDGSLPTSAYLDWTEGYPPRFKHKDAMNKLTAIMTPNVQSLAKRAMRELTDCCDEIAAIFELRETPGSAAEVRRRQAAVEARLSAVETSVLDKVGEAVRKYDAGTRARENRRHVSAKKMVSELVPAAERRGVLTSLPKWRADLLAAFEAADEVEAEIRSVRGAQPPWPRSPLG